MSNKKSKTKALEKIQPDYNERTAQVQKKAQAALFKQARGLWKQLESAKDSMEKTTILAVNTASQLGAVMLQICGGDQLGFPFWTSHCAKQLPFNLDTAQEMISVHKKVPTPITTMEQAFVVLKQLNLGLGLLKLPERTEDQNPSGQSPLTAVTHAFQQGYNVFQKWIEKEPLADWDRSRLETIFAETKQVHDLHEQVAKLLPKSGA